KANERRQQNKFYNHPLSVQRLKLQRRPRDAEPASYCSVFPMTTAARCRSRGWATSRAYLKANSLTTHQKQAIVMKTKMNATTDHRKSGLVCAMKASGPKNETSRSTAPVTPRAAFTPPSSTACLTLTQRTSSELPKAIRDKRSLFISAMWPNKRDQAQR